MSVTRSLLGRALRYRPLRVRTPDGVAVSVQDHDHGGGGVDVLFVHGFSQSHLAWIKQLSGPLAERHRLISWDLRGHGASDKPLDPSHYRDPDRWADEVRAVIDATGLVRPVIVCWSYGGRVALDFLRQAGPDAISGLVMVAATSTAGPHVLGTATPLLRAMASADDLAANHAATSALLAACTVAPLSEDERALMLAYNMMVPVDVRFAMTGRPADYDDVLAGMDMPVLAIHGAHDPINRVAMSEYCCDRTNGDLLVYADCAHMPFWEEAERFDADLSAFLDKVARGIGMPAAAMTNGA